MTRGILSPQEQQKFIVLADKYISSKNKIGNEQEIIQFGKKITKEFGILSQKEYLKLLCNSQYPLTAAMTLYKNRFEEIELLRDFVYGNLDMKKLTLSQKLLTQLYLNYQNQLISTINDNDNNDLVNGIGEAVRFLISNEEYELFFLLFSIVTQSNKIDKAYKKFTRYELKDYYILRHSQLINSSILTLYNNNHIDCLFYICKDFRLFNSLTEILGKTHDELFKEFFNIRTMNGLRLSFRVLQNRYSDDERAYLEVINEISKIEKTEEIKLVYIYYLLKLVILRQDFDDEIEAYFNGIGKIKSIENPYGIDLVAEAQETVLKLHGFTKYWELCEALGENNVFTYDEDNQIHMPYTFNKNSSNTEIEERKEFVKGIATSNHWNLEKGINFYMNSYLKCYLPITDFLSVCFPANEDRVIIRKFFKKYIFVGEVISKDEDEGFITVSFKNVVARHNLYINRKKIGVSLFDLIKVGGLIEFRLNKYNPENDYITGMKYQPYLNNRLVSSKELNQVSWNKLKGCFDKIISSGTVSNEDLKLIRELPSLQFDKNGLIVDYVFKYSALIHALCSQPEAIVSVLKALEVKKNNLFAVSNKKSEFISFDKESCVLNDQSYSSIDTLKEIEIDISKLIWIYLNSHLKFIVEIQNILDFINPMNEKNLRIDDLFYNYRFLGIFNNFHTNDKGIESGYVNPTSFKSRSSVGFIMDKENILKDELVKGRNMVTFRLRKYFGKSGYIGIEDVQPKIQNYRPNSWAKLHNLHDQVKQIKTLRIEMLNAIKLIPRLERHSLDLGKFLEDYDWCMKNLSDQGDSVFKYLNALNDNNPYKYNQDKKDGTRLLDLYGNDIDENYTILGNLTRNNRLESNIWVYLNSYLRKNIPLESVIERCFTPKNIEGVRSINQLSDIEIIAKIKDIDENQIYLNLIDINCAAKVLFEVDTIESSDNFKPGESLKVFIYAYDWDNRIIYVEPYHI